MTVALAMDLGGTKSLLGLVDATGTVLYSERRPSIFPIEPDTLIDRLAGWVREMEGKGGFDKIGIGMAGQVNAATGTLMSTCLSSDRLDIGLAHLLARRTGYPVIADNDAVAALIGERWKGAVRNFHHVVLLTIGTGLGGALWDDRHILRGSRGAALQVGHSVFSYDGLPCSCGSKGCAETYISGTGIREAYLRKTGSSLPSEDIFRLYRQSDPAAQEVVKAFFDQCGTLVAGLANLLNPEAFLIGGGVGEALSEEELLQIENKARQLALPANGFFSLERAILGNDAGMIGSAYLAHYELADSLNYKHI